MNRETGKQRAQRIELDYYRKRDWPRYTLAVVGLLTAVAYVAYALLPSSRRTHISTGSLALPHASFEDKCEKCHQNFTPMNPISSNLSIPWFGSNTESLDTLTERSAAACLACHRIGGHHRDVMNNAGKSRDGNCVDCHSDHQGRDHLLVSSSSQQCVTCHEKIGDFCSSAATESNVNQFAKGKHSNFRSLANDNGQVKFDHGQHMRPGQADEGKLGAFTIDRLEGSQRDRYDADADGQIQLRCSDCHQLAGNLDKAKFQHGDMEVGRNMGPISFEEHCSACHAIYPVIATKDTLALPHATPWPKLKLLIAGTLNGAVATDQARMPRDDRQDEPVPGDGPGDKPNSTPVMIDAEPYKSIIDDQCTVCHPPGMLDQAANLTANSPSLIPQRWLEHGIFDHAAHQSMECKFCHAAAHAENIVGGPPDDNKKVMIDGIDKCVDCHRDGNELKPFADNPLFGNQPKWASDSCTLCHRYHAQELSGSLGNVTESSSESGP